MNVGLRAGVPNSVVGTTMQASSKEVRTRSTAERSMAEQLGWSVLLRNFLAPTFSLAKRSEAERIKAAKLCAV